MDVWINHWHCIIPAAAILLAMVFLRDRDGGKNKRDEHEHAQEE